MGLDYRIGRHFLNAGLGFGGSCFPKDVKALISFSSGLGYEPSILKAVLNVNERQALRGVEMVKSLLGELRGKRIALLGLSFKPETSDIREAPSLKIIKYLLEEGAEVVAYDPAAIDEVKRILGEKISYAASPIECLKGSDCCMVVTEWDEFRKLTPEDFLANMRYPALVDGRRIYDPEVFSKKLKFKAIGLSRP
jgi:UDPglucose 6-dehydrogenase